MSIEGHQQQSINNWKWIRRSNWCRVCPRTAINQFSDVCDTSTLWYLRRCCFITHRQLLLYSLRSRTIMLLILESFFSGAFQIMFSPNCMSQIRLKSFIVHLYDMNNLFGLCWNQLWKCVQYMFVVCWVLVIHIMLLFLLLRLVEGWSIAWVERKASFEKRRKSIKACKLFLVAFTNIGANLIWRESRHVICENFCWLNNKKLCYLYAINNRNLNLLTVYGAQKAFQL